MLIALGQLLIYYPFTYLLTSEEVVSAAVLNHHIVIIIIIAIIVIAVIAEIQCLFRGSPISRLRFTFLTLCSPLSNWYLRRSHSHTGSANNM